MHFNEYENSEENIQVQATPAAKKRTVTPNKKAQLQSIIESPLNLKDDTHEEIGISQKHTSLSVSVSTNTSLESKPKRRVRRRLFAPETT